MTIKRWKTYTGYSIACGIVWAAIWIIYAIVGGNHTHTIALVFGGWVIGWISATIARAVYPPPKPKPS